MSSLIYNGVEYPEGFSKEQFENFTDVPKGVVDRHFLTIEAKKKRAAAYPDMGEQLDYIYHHGVEKWKSDIIDPVKKKYPTS